MYSVSTDTNFLPLLSVSGGDTHKGSNREERKKKKPSSMTQHALLIFKSDKPFEFLASQDSDSDDGLRALLLVSLAAAAVAMECHSG